MWLDHFVSFYLSLSSTWPASETPPAPHPFSSPNYDCDLLIPGITLSHECSTLIDCGRDAGVSAPRLEKGKSGIHEDDVFWRFNGAAIWAVGT